MDCAPLNLAHFHERRAEKLVKRHHYDEAYKAIETSLLYIQDAHKTVRIQKAIEVLNTQKWDYERKLQQIKMRQQQYERNKVKEIIPPATQNETTNANINAQSIDKTVKEFNDKYGSTSLLVNMQHLQLESENEYPKKDLNVVTNHDQLNEINEHVDVTAKKRLSIFDDHLQTDEDLPSLAPLELPSFDYNIYGVSGLAENLQK